MRLPSPEMNYDTHHQFYDLRTQDSIYAQGFRHAFAFPTSLAGLRVENYRKVYRQSKLEFKGRLVIFPMPENAGTCLSGFRTFHQFYNNTPDIGSLDAVE